MSVQPTLIALAGPSGSGKTLLANALAGELQGGGAVVLSADRDYRDLSHLTPAERERVNFDEPQAVDAGALAADLAALKSGKAVWAPVYDFATHTRGKSKKSIRPAKWIVVEGLHLLHWPECRTLFDYRVYVDAPHAACLRRRVARDIHQRRRTEADVVAQYDSAVRPMCDRYIRPSARFADTIVDALDRPGDALDKIIGGLLRAEGAKAAELRRDLLDDLQPRFAAGAARSRWRHLSKKYLWQLAVEGAKAVKRLTDVAVSGSLLILLSPLLLAVALAIKLTDGGPIFFVQRRVGKWGREFFFPKFRSMVVNAEALKDSILSQSHHGDSVTFKMKRDPRITWIGRIIRKLSIDELPQLWNVLKGDMSLVGPRPPVPREVAQYTLSDRRRLNATPGLTCIWQVSGRGDIAFPEQVELDVQYIESQSFWTDLRILFLTVPAVLTGKGAY